MSRPSDQEARELVIQITNELFSMGLLTATGGNISSVANEEGTLWITPSQMYKGDLHPDDLVRIRYDGTVIEGDRKPSIEHQMHARAYEARPDSTGAVHTHAPIATAFGICNQKFPPINTDAVFLRDTVTVPWLMPGSVELADAVGGALKQSRGCILQNHGLMTVGPSAGTVEPFVTMGPWPLPTINTALLLTSGVTLTIAHHALIANHRAKCILWMWITVILGATFLGVQAYEYIHAYRDLNLKLSSGVFGSTFFMLTGFHGFHVFVGMLMLLFITLRLMKGHFTPENHFGFEGAAWYWHFVDVVWLGLYFLVYWL